MFAGKTARAAKPVTLGAVGAVVLTSPRAERRAGNCWTREPERAPKCQAHVTEPGAVTSGGIWQSSVSGSGYTMHSVAQSTAEPVAIACARDALATLS
ncbi:hypothetical protein [Streptacidiphilus pinicola]|uniref:hypothetical protein n=1 Tax=Streptacidiphilus pinicola TaxID=2219663 RepID=UPI001057EC66|nr:hypothetical protein [Streptacidiphilus pinicola]